jgi:uncharacterized protein with PQ loop repeat
MEYIEILGIAAAVIILVSSLFKNMMILRTINLIGAALFCVYGILTGALSVWMLNGGLVVTQVIQIAVLLKKHKAVRRKTE